MICFLYINYLGKIMQDVREILKDIIPTDCCRQFTALDIISHNYGTVIEEREQIKLLDLGAGNGDAHDSLNKILKNIKYVGLDIEESPEVLKRTRCDLSFRVYDGVNIPFDDNEFDIIFCKQVLEHVRYPDDVISDVLRVLKPGGFFVGSVSFLEPYHSYSIFNWSPYGLFRVFEDNNVKLLQLRPGIDGVSMIFRSIFGRDKFNVFFSVESLFNYYLESKLTKNSTWSKNWNKLMISGHVCWLAQKPYL